MGQEQSNSKSSLASVSGTPSTSSTSRNESLLQHHLNKGDEKEDSIVLLEEEEGEERKEGIIKVIDGPAAEEDDEELELLRSIKKFDPFIKEQEKSFRLDSLLGLKAANIRATSRENVDNENVVIDMFFELQAHIKDQMRHVNNEQRILLRRIAHVDELSTCSANTITTAFNQAKLASQKVGEVQILRNQATKIHETAISIFKTLSILEKHLDPEDRIRFSETNDTSWLELKKLRAQSSKALNPLLRSATKNDLTTVGTSTSPLLEKIIVAGEPAYHVNENDTVLNPMEQVGTSSTSTSSLALSTLRGLSSRSIHALEE